MSQRILVISSIIFIGLILLIPSVCTIGSGETLVSYHSSEVQITADPSISYTVNGVVDAPKVVASYGEEVVIRGINLPYGKYLHADIIIGSSTYERQGYEITISGFPQDRVMLIRVHLSLATDPHPPIIDNGGEGGGNDDDNEDDPEGGNNDPGTNPEPENPKPSNPVNPGRPVVPDTPGTDTPSDPEHPDTPGSDEPGSDEPYTPLLPPAGSVYNFAGFIPLVAGFLLLFLVFFWRRKVYRILKSHAKKYGEKPEKEHLKEIADAIIKLVRDDGRYPEWKKNSDVAKRLSADIVSVLDEMNYARAVPRGALVAEILKAAKGRINRHRL